MANEYQFDKLAAMVLRQGAANAKIAKTSAMVLRQGGSDLHIVKVSAMVLRSVASVAPSAGRRRQMIND